MISPRAFSELHGRMGFWTLVLSDISSSWHNHYAKFFCEMKIINRSSLRVMVILYGHENAIIRHWAFFVLSSTGLLMLVLKSNLGPLSVLTVIWQSSKQHSEGQTTCYSFECLGALGLTLPWCKFISKAHGALIWIKARTHKKGLQPSSWFHFPSLKELRGTLYASL